MIIDGNNLLFQMFYGLPKVVEKTSGRPIHGTIGFISFVIKEIKVTGATRGHWWFSIKMEQKTE